MPVMTSSLELITSLLNQLFLICFVVLLTDFRKPAKLWKLGFFIGVFLITGVNLWLMTLQSHDRFMKTVLLTMTLWYFLLLFFVSNFRGWRGAFNISTVVFLGMVDWTVVYAFVLMGVPFWMQTLLCIIIYVLLLLLVKRLRSAYFHMLRLLNHGWMPLFCATMLLDTAMLLCLSFRNSLLKPLQALAINACCCVLGVLIYAMVLVLWERAQAEYDSHRNADLLSTQVAALQNQIHAVMAAKESICIERHDLHHRLYTVGILVKKGDSTGALRYISDSEHALREIKIAHWCSNTVLNAVLSFYFDQAMQADIEVDAHLVLDNNLPVDTTALSTVFANLLENAIIACKTLPKGHRKIICKGIDKPCFMLEVANSFSGCITFNSDGLPLSERDGHGIGTRSIAAFCKKYDAFCSYEAKNGWFFAKIAL